VDRWRLRRTLVATYLLQVAALAPLFAVTPSRTWPVYIVVVLQGLISSVNDPASFAVLPRVVEEDELVPANSLLNAGGSVARLVGAAAGGIAVAGGSLDVVILADASTFIVGAAAGAAMGPAADRVAVSDDTEGEVDTSIRDGIRAVRARPAVAAIVGIEGLAMVAFGAFPVLFIVFVTDVLDGGGTEIGVIRAMSAFGGIVASLVIGRVAAKTGPARVMAGGYLLFAVLALVFVNAPSITTTLWVYLVLFALTGVPNVATRVGTNATAQTICPPEVLGRLGGLMSAARALGMGTGSLAAGLLLDVFSVRELLNAQATFLLLAGVATVLFVTRRLPATPDDADGQRPDL
jgi:predicted MFS family arabinose efflux permease